MFPHEPTTPDTKAKNTPHEHATHDPDDSLSFLETPLEKRSAAVGAFAATCCCCCCYFCCVVIGSGLSDGSAFVSRASGGVQRRRRRRRRRWGGALFALVRGAATRIGHDCFAVVPDRRRRGRIPPGAVVPIVSAAIALAHFCRFLLTGVLCSGVPL